MVFLHKAPRYIKDENIDEKGTNAIVDIFLVIRWESYWSQLSSEYSKDLQ